MIYKPNTSFGGHGIKIINKLNKLNKYKNASITKYIEHTKHYVGHFLVIKGIIINRIYFNSINKIHEIKYGRIKNYQIEEKITCANNNIDSTNNYCDDSIFDKIFYNLNYSGFADSDFIQVNNKIIIFEINPRPGGSLIFNNEYFNKFLDSIISKLL